jgi:zinc and cadmium transporter
MVNYFHLFLLAAFASILALVGGVLFLYNKRLSGVLEKNSIPFAAGVMITVSLLALLPEAVEHLGPSAYLVMLLAFLGSYAFEHLIFGIHHHADHDHKGLSSSIPLVVVGDTIHNFIDGVAIGASYLINPSLGLITAISTFMHEVPHEIGDFGILLRSGWKKTKILTLNIISASTTILGAFSMVIFSENESLIGTLLGVAAGIFFYLGAIDFLPRAGHGFPNKLKAAIPMAIGVILMLIIINLIPHAELE